MGEKILQVVKFKVSTEEKPKVEKIKPLARHHQPLEKDKIEKSGSRILPRVIIERVYDTAS